jgi:serine phosphatase RsbU (regulator of sigma subunit)
MNSDHRMFDDDRLRATLLAARGASAEQTLQAIVAAVIDFTGDMPQSDDLTLFVVKRQAQSTARGEKS